MNFRDTWVTDENDQRFIFTVEMQRKLYQQGLSVEPASLKLLRDTPPRPVEPTPARDQSRDERRDDRRDERRDERRDDREERDQPVVEIEGPSTIQIDPATGKYIGRVKWYNARKGYGFIMRGGGEEIFFHKSGSMGDPVELQDGQWVLYDVEDTKKGPEATDVEDYEGEIPE